jgi:hypothetical protein
VVLRRGALATILIICFSKLMSDPRVLRQISALNQDYRVVTCGFGETPEGAAAHYRIPDGLKFRPAGILGLAALTVRAHGAAAKRVPAAVAAEELLADVGFDLVLTNDVNAVAVATRIAGGRPLVVDLHEFALDESTDWRWRLLIRPLNNYLCEEYVRNASATTTVAPGIAAEYEDRFGFSPRLVLNAPLFQDPSPKPVGNPLRLVHHGAAIRDRMLESMIRAVGGLNSASLDLYLVRMAADPGYVDELISVASGYENVRIRPPVDFDEIQKMLTNYDMGVYLLSPASFNDLHALPNKFFEFIQSGLPIIIGPSPEMAALTERYGLGAVLSDWEVSSLRKCLEGITEEQVAEWQVNVCAAAKELSGEVSAAVIRDVVSESLPSGN